MDNIIIFILRYVIHIISFARENLIASSGNLKAVSPLSKVSIVKFKPCISLDVRFHLPQTHIYLQSVLTPAKCEKRDRLQRSFPREIQSRRERRSHRLVDLIPISTYPFAVSYGSRGNVLMNEARA